jgi:hypothetical protein
MDPDPERDRRLALSRRAMGSKSARTSCSAKRLSSISLQVMLRKVGFGWRICLITGWKIEPPKRERGICTSDSEAGRREIVTSVGFENELDIV